MTTAFTTVAGQASADPFSAQIGLASEYVGKGLGKSDGDPALSGSVRWAENGAYAIVFVTQAASSKGADSEIVLTGGYQHKVGDWGFDGLILYRELQNETNGIDSGNFEFQGDVSRDLNERVSARLRVNYTPDAYGNSDAAWWTEAQGTLTLTSRDKLSAAYGVRRVDNGTDYDAWNIGVKHKFTSAFSGDLRWYDTDGHEFGSRYDGRLVASVAYSF